MRIGRAVVVRRAIDRCIIGYSITVMIDARLGVP